MLTKSSTDAELLALSHVGSEMIWWTRLFKYMRLTLYTPTLYCDNLLEDPNKTSGTFRHSTSRTTSPKQENT